MNTISLIGLLVIAACFVLTMVSLRRWDDELRAFQDATIGVRSATHERPQKRRRNSHKKRVKL